MCAFRAVVCASASSILRVPADRTISSMTQGRSQLTGISFPAPCAHPFSRRKERNRADPQNRFTSPALFWLKEAGGTPWLLTPESYSTYKSLRNSSTAHSTKSGRIRRGYCSFEKIAEFNVLVLGAPGCVSSSSSTSRADSAVVGLEANKTKRNSAPVACSAAAGCGWRDPKPGADYARERNGSV